MKLDDSFTLSLNSIIHRKLRAWLTLLGIVIGVGAVVAIISIGEGAQASVTANLSDFKTDVITISAGVGGANSFRGVMRGGATPGAVPGGGFSISSSSSSSDDKTPQLEDRDVRAIRANTKIESVNQIVSGRGDFVFLDEETTASITGVNPVTWLDTQNVELAEGRLLGASDSDSIVIGDRIANDTFKKEITLGRKVVIEDETFTVVGILASGSNDSSVFMNYKAAWQVTDVNEGVYSQIQAKVKDPSAIDESIASLDEDLAISRRVTERTKDFSITSSASMQEQISETLDTLTLFLGAIAAVSLVVGAVGVANSMFTSVLEKTKEIGIMKSLGATEKEIVILFIIESGLFGFVGGVIGAVIGLGLSVLLASLLSMNTFVSGELMVIAVLLSTGIGIFSGVMPAISASKLKPVEALRYE